MLDEAVRSVRARSLPAELETLVFDLADLDSARSAAKQVADTETVDLLVNNAEVMNLPERQTTRDGFEMMFGTNHLGPRPVGPYTVRRRQSRSSVPGYST